MENHMQHAEQHTKSETIVPPYPWATNRRATICNRQYLVDNGITTITGDVQCMTCQKKYEVSYDLLTKLQEVKDYTFIIRRGIRRKELREEAPRNWLLPRSAGCKFCGKKRGVKPVISEKKKGINWLFLLLGQMLGYCTLEQLKYFHKHTRKHTPLYVSTWGKGGVLYFTYLELFRQLEPEGPP
ncbi:hypothetical protein Ancab_011266 [Ancistrocladus abbreviatus]